MPRWLRSALLSAFVVVVCSLIGGVFGPGVAGVSPERILDGVIDRAGLVDDIISAIETRAIWARFGL